MADGIILVVDDEPLLLGLIRDWLDGAGYTVYTAGDAAEALQRFTECQPTLVITDLRLPGMDGFQLIQRIREISDTFIMAFTALGTDEHLIYGLDLGADDYVVKPVYKSQFLARVYALLRRSAMHD